MKSTRKGLKLTLKKKRIISFLIAAVMMTSIAMPSAPVFAEEGAVVSASSAVTEETVDQSTQTEQENQADSSENVEESASQPVDEEISEAVEETSEEEPAESAGPSEAVEEVAQLFRELPAVIEVANMDEQQLEDTNKQMARAIQAFEDLTAEDMDFFTQNYADLYTTVLVDLMDALAQASGNPVEDLSLRPMPETRNVYLNLTGKSRDEISKFPVDQVLSLLVDEKGQKVEVEEGYTDAWFYFVQEDIDESHKLNNDEVVDLWDYRYGELNWNTNYSLCLVLSKDGQLGDNHHRYIITVEVGPVDTTSVSLEFTLYNKNGTQIDTYGSKTFADTSDSEVLEKLDILGKAVTYYSDQYTESETYSIAIDDTYINQLVRKGIDVQVYPMGVVLDYLENDVPLSGAITDQVFSDTGYACDYDTEITQENAREAQNLWCMVLSSKETNRVIGYIGLAMRVQPERKTSKAAIWNYQNSQMVELNSALLTFATERVGITVDPQSQERPIIINDYTSSQTVATSVPKGSSLKDAFYVTIQNNGNIKKVYDGNFWSEQAAIANGAKDCTSQILYKEGQKPPFGYKVVLENTRYFTIVMTDGSIKLCSFYMYESGGGTTPPKQQADPYFQIQAAYEKDEEYDFNRRLDTYVADMVGSIQLDTYYRRDDRYDVGGYQLILINKQMSEQELKKIIPSFWTPQGITVNSGGRVVSGETSLEKAVWSDKLKDTVAYQVQVPGEKLKNYQVTFASQQEEATLFVAGPDERFVNLTADNNFVHDILVANIGATDLTGLNVELIDPVNVKLDQYWTLGGEGNDTLPAFDSTSNYYQPGDGTSEYNQYATLDNIAKVRLLADGEGDISGTLRITAANGQKRDIKLTGIASNPHIISGELDEAVKYVPYSYMIVTDNMYKWNRSTFKIIDGKLPAGLELYKATGEIYGAPQETGTFKFTVQVDYSSSRFESSVATFTLTVNENTNKNVYMQTDEGYSIQVPLGVEQGDNTYDFVLSDPTKDQLYVSNGVFPEFIDLWLNGERLIRDVDYTVESGSTRMTIKGQTFEDKASEEGSNTIAAEFRVDGDKDKELKRTAQNFRLGEIETNPGGGGTDGNGGSNGNGGDQTQPAVPQGVTMRFHLVDENGNAMAGMLVELHSTPRTGVTDANGDVVFAGVEYGTHTLIVKDGNGNVVASRQFQLVPGAAGFDNMTITAQQGSSLLVDVQCSGGSLSFVNVIPQTGDAFNLTLVLMLMAISGAAAVTIYIYRRRRVLAQS